MPAVEEWAFATDCKEIHMWALSIPEEIINLSMQYSDEKHLSQSTIPLTRHHLHIAKRTSAMEIAERKVIP